MKLKRYTAGLSKVVLILGVVFKCLLWVQGDPFIIIGSSTLSLTYLLGCLGSSTLGQKLHGIAWCIALMGALFAFFNWPFTDNILPIGCVLLIVSSVLAALRPVEG